MVPTKLFKAVYDPQRQESGAHLLDNTADAQPEKISIIELENNTAKDVKEGAIKELDQKLKQVETEVLDAFKELESSNNSKTRTTL